MTDLNQSNLWENGGLGRDTPENVPVGFSGHDDSAVAASFSSNALFARQCLSTEAQVEDEEGVLSPTTGWCARKAECFCCSLFA